jgi:PPOX class probable F420-dependent enzyme
VKQRNQVAMTEQEVADLLAGSRKVQLATINRDGTPHLVTMYYAMIDGRIAFWTYRASQKARNLDRDPRLTCLVESGNQYFDLRGAQVQGVARRVEEPGAVREIGRLIVAGMGDLVGSGAGPGALEEYVEHAARKRVGFVVEPRRISSWDHGKLLPPG